ncbi:MAG: hypothetical protein ABSA13_05490 [Beijerinckiaceae bacterium]|jgi:hypothetical protein
MSDLARQSFTVTRHAYDPRADSRLRTVHMSMTQVSIERVMDGIKMRIAVPVAAYDALRVRVHAPRGVATLTLSHDDPDLNVELASGEATEIAIAAKAWAAVLEKTLVIEAGVLMRPPEPRSLKRPKPSRRSSFSKRRKPGLLGLLGTSFKGEREIIARN